MQWWGPSGVTSWPSTGPSRLWLCSSAADEQLFNDNNTNFSVPCSLTEPWLESCLAAPARHLRPSPGGPEPFSCRRCLFLPEVSNYRLWHVTLTPRQPHSWPSYTPSLPASALRLISATPSSFSDLRRKLKAHAAVFISSPHFLMESLTYSAPLLWFKSFSSYKHLQHLLPNALWICKLVTNWNQPNVCPFTKELLRNHT